MLRRIQVYHELVQICILKQTFSQIPPYQFHKRR